MNANAWMLHATETQTLVRDIQGTDTPQAGDQWRQTAGNIYGWVTISDAGDSVIAVAECYSDRDMIDRIKLIGWGTNAINYVKIYAPSGQRHTGVANTGFKIYVPDADNILELNDVDILIQYIEFHGGGRQITGTYRYGIRTIRIDSCIFHDNIWGAMIDIPNNAYLTTMIWNSVFYSSFSAAIGPGHYSADVHVENCSIYNPGGIGVFRAECYNVVTHRGENAVDPGFGDECTGDYNCDGVEVETDGSAPGLNSLHNQTLSDISWVCTDLHPAENKQIDLHTYTDYYTDSVLIGQGVDRSAGVIGFNTDIDGDPRIGLWTIGVDQKAYSSSSSSASSSSASSASVVSSSSSSGSTFDLRLRDITYDV